MPPPHPGRTPDPLAFGVLGRRRAGWPGQPRSAEGAESAAPRQAASGLRQCGFNLIVPKYCYNTNHVPPAHLQLISGEATE